MECHELNDTLGSLLTNIEKSASSTPHSQYIQISTDVFSNLKQIATDIKSRFELLISDWDGLFDVLIHEMNMTASRHFELKKELSMLKLTHSVTQR